MTTKVFIFEDVRGLFNGGITHGDIDELYFGCPHKVVNFVLKNINERNKTIIATCPYHKLNIEFYARFRKRIQFG
ncbi:hypothetical protein A2771_01720 [Candidatus Woesebacteria bacterium RIFCSPHIGHO2_01_FULL_38_26b]|uniref:Uncharacterized protein n=1 Tax=Candidatus Woesebacteria bacterium RIFCSPHIGHO2_01_FULL_38_26b TaxID=1802491 RepID=A0A1F7XXK8_9BACT|nr:MAG: hypothetical protein A2771_01720 [Candidatus Woesebacteria bacterium RIFCSPHIGHO2_01_FULL_38_26b]